MSVNSLKILFVFIVYISVPFISCVDKEKKLQLPWDNGPLVVSENGRFLQHENGKPFFWLGDTGWLLCQNLNRGEVEQYLENRRQKAFNVIQVMLLHELPQVNVYGARAFSNNSIIFPLCTEGNNFDSDFEYDYWDHIDFVLETARQKGIYLAMVPVWGSLVKDGYFNQSSIKKYGEWLANRYKNRSNIIWINGGDIRGDVCSDIWKTLGKVLKENDPGHLITFHPFGRTQSSLWFHNENWLDFNMFQSGHRRYDQIRDSDDINTWKGEDNWKYVVEDYTKVPPKPTIDGEPSYENIPQGLHDPTQPYWKAEDIRRYAYWSVFAGAFGHTYGNNAVMQMYKPGMGKGDYGVNKYWYESLDDSGAFQMNYLKNLITSRPFEERIWDPAMIAGKNGMKYDYIIATRGNNFAMFYIYTGRDFDVLLGRISGERVRAWWFNPRNNSTKLIGIFKNKGMMHFDPPGIREEGNDWVLVLDDVNEKFCVPGSF